MVLKDVAYNFRFYCTIKVLILLRSIFYVGKNVYNNHYSLDHIIKYVHFYPRLLLVFTQNFKPYTKSVFIFVNFWVALATREELYSCTTTLSVYVVLHKIVFLGAMAYRCFQYIN